MSGRGGRFGLRKKVSRIAETEEKPAVKPKPPPRPPVARPVASKQPIVDGGPKTPAEKKEVKHDLSKDEDLQKLLVDERKEDARSDVEEEFDEFFGDGDNTGFVPPVITDEEGEDLFGDLTGNETISVSGTSEKLDFLGEEMPESPLMPESYEEEVTEELDEIPTSDILDEEESDEEVGGAKPPPLPQPKFLEPMEIDMPSAEPVKEEKKEATTGEMETREAKKDDAPVLRAHSLIGTKPRSPEADEDLKEKYARETLRTLDGIYDDIPKKPYLLNEVPGKLATAYTIIKDVKDESRKAELLAKLASRHQRFGKEYKKNFMLSNAERIYKEAVELAKGTGNQKLAALIEKEMAVKFGVKPAAPKAMPQVVMPASEPKKEAPDDAETRAASTDEAETKAVEEKPQMPQVVMPASDHSRAAGENDETKAVTTAPTPTKKKQLPKPEMPPSKQTEELADTEETKAIVTKAAEAGVKVASKTELQILLTLERRFKRWGLVDGNHADVSMEDAVMGILKKNPTLLAAIVSGLIKNNDEVRNIIFNEQSAVLGEMRAMKKELDEKREELKGLEARVRNTESMVERAEAAAEKAKDSASEVAGVKGYVDERVDALAEVVDEELDEKVETLAKVVDEELKEKMGALGNAVDEELEAKTKEMKGYTDDKIEALRKDIDEELEEKKKEMESYVDGKVETLESAVHEESDGMKSELKSEIEKSAGKAKEEAIEDAKGYADSKAETARAEAIKKMKDYTDKKVSDDVGEATEEMLKTATERISDAVKGISEKTIEPMQDALKTMLGNRYEKAELGKEVMNATAVTAVAGALSESRYIEMSEAFGKEYGNEVAKAALESIAGMEPKKLAMSEQLYDENGELDVEKAETIIKRANNILNR